MKMPRTNRYNELLTLFYGLFFPNDDTTDLAAGFYGELRNVSVNFRNEAIVKLDLYVITLLSKHNEISIENNELNEGDVSLREDLSAGHTARIRRRLKKTRVSAPDILLQPQTPQPKAATLPYLRLMFFCFYILNELNEYL